MRDEKKIKPNPLLRPLSARALKSLIDTLRPFLYGANILDLYAGQGRFGLDCLKEGAEKVTFVEKHAPTAKEIKNAALKKKHTHFQVINQDAFDFLTDVEEHFDVILTDPPFHIWNDDFVSQLSKKIDSILKPEGIWVIKYPEKASLPFFVPFILYKEKTFGESRLLFLKKQN